MNHKQQILLDNFFENKNTWFSNGYLYKFVAGILLFIAALMYIMPYQLWEGDYKIMILIFYLELMGLEIYLTSYCHFIDEDGKIKNIYEIIRYLPVSHKQLALYRLKKLTKICLWLTGITAFCQIFFTITFLHDFSIGNLLIPVLCCLIVPEIMIGSSMFWRK